VDRLRANLATCGLALLGLATVLAVRTPVTDPLGDPTPGDWQEKNAALQPPGPSGAPLVVWAGDSTILAIRVRPYPILVRANLLAPSGVRNLVEAGAGFTFYQYYCLMGPLVDVHPALVVLALNLRTFWTVQRDAALLCGHLPAGELLQAATLPLSDADMPLPHLLLAQGLRWSWLRQASRLLTVTRGELDDLQVAVGLPPRVGTHAAAWRFTETSGAHPEASVEGLLDGWRTGARARAASFRMLAATVRLARSSGAGVLVVVSPAPVAALTEAAAWNQDGYRDLLAQVRTTVMREGGVVADLHDAVDLAGFHDGDGFHWQSGHLNDSGAATVAERLQPVVAGMLRIPARPVMHTRPAGKPFPSRPPPSGP
jgi:hypothetical protein